MDEYRVNRFVSHDLQFEGDGIDTDTSKPKRNLNDYLKTGTEVSLKTMKGTVKIKGLWQLKDDVLYDYVGNSLDNIEGADIYFNNDDIIVDTDKSDGGMKI